jgi:hypothetical protein
MIQWVGDEVEVVQANEEVCIAMTESQVDIQGGKMKCFIGRDLLGYNYVSVGKDGFVPISVKPAIGANRLAHDLVYIAMINKDLEWLCGQIEEYHSSKDDAMGVMEDLDEIGKLGRGFSTMDDLDKVDIGDGVVARPTYVSACLTLGQKDEMCEMLKAYTCCFAWDYTEIPGLSSELVEHRLPIKASLDHINREPRTLSLRSSER